MSPNEQLAGVRAGGHLSKIPRSSWLFWSAGGWLSTDNLNVWWCSAALHGKKRKKGISSVFFSTCKSALTQICCTVNRKAETCCVRVPVSCLPRKACYFETLSGMWQATGSQRFGDQKLGCLWVRCRTRRRSNLGCWQKWHEWLWQHASAAHFSWQKKEKVKFSPSEPWLKKLWWWGKKIFHKEWLVATAIKNICTLASVIWTICFSHHLLLNCRLSVTHPDGFLMTKKLIRWSDPWTQGPVVLFCCSRRDCASVGPKVCWNHRTVVRGRKTQSNVSLIFFVAVFCCCVCHQCVRICA